MTLLAVAPMWEERTESEPTLAALLGTVWEELAAGRAVECPICQDEMTPEYGQHARPLGGRCRHCGSQLR